MSHKYDFDTLKAAILFNSQEVLPGDEAQLDKELRALINAANESGEPIRHYIGFEISGQIHFPGSVFQMLNVAKLQQAGVECTVWLADYHTRINKKLDGKMETIRSVAQNYFEPIFRLSLQVAGGDPGKLKVLYAENEYFRKNADDYSFWDYEFEVEENISLNRVVRSLSIAGKEAGEGIDYQITRYPGMQAADVFWLQTHIVSAGLDQRKIYVIARDVADKISDDFKLKIGDKSAKPIVAFTNLLLGLERPKEVLLENTDLTIEEQQNLSYLQSEIEANQVVDLSQIDQTVAQTTIKLIGQHQAKTVEVNKMSKSKPDSAVWVHDSPEEILRKLKKAYCPMPRPTEQSMEEIESEQAWNPMLDWSQKMIFPSGKKIVVSRKPEWGGDIVYSDFENLKNDYFTGKLHPMDLKAGVAACLSEWFAPIREWVEANPEPLEFLKSVKN